MRWLVNATPRPLYPSGKTHYALCRRVGGPQGRSGRVRKISPPPEFDPRIIKPVAIRCADYAIPSHIHPILFVLILSLVVFGEVLVCLKFISHTHTNTHIYNVFLHCCMFVSLPDQIESMAPANSVL